MSGEGGEGESEGESESESESVRGELSEVRADVRTRFIKVFYKYE